MWGVVIFFVSIIGWRSMVAYTRQNVNALVAAKDQELRKLQTSVYQYKYKLKNLREDYDIDPDEGEFIDDTESTEGQISDLVKIIYPKMPTTLARILDKPGLQEAILKQVEKRPELLGTIIDKFARPEEKAAQTAAKYGYGV